MPTVSISAKLELAIDGAGASAVQLTRLDAQRLADALLEYAGAAVTRGASRGAVTTVPATEVDKGRRRAGVVYVGHKVDRSSPRPVVYLNPTRK